jgi:hypothetical protein
MSSTNQAIEATIYRNVRSGALGLSFDDENVVGPAGKAVPIGDLWEEESADLDLGEALSAMTPTQIEEVARVAELRANVDGIAARKEEARRQDAARLEAARAKRAAWLASPEGREAQRRQDEELAEFSRVFLRLLSMMRIRA